MAARIGQKAPYWEAQAFVRRSIGAQTKAAHWNCPPVIVGEAVFATWKCLEPSDSPLVEKEIEALRARDLHGCRGLEAGANCVESSQLSNQTVALGE